MIQRKWLCGLVAAWTFSGLGSVALMSAGCQSDTHGEIQKEPSAEVQESSGGPAPHLYYEPELDFFYASVQESGGDPQLEEGYALLFYDHDMVGALEHFLKAPAQGPEQKLGRAVGLGRTALTFSRWFQLVGQFQAEANLQYVAALEASHGRSEPLSETERAVAGRSALYLGRKAEAQKFLGALPEEPDKARQNWTVDQVRATDWKTPTDGRFWDPYAFDAAARAYRNLAHDSFQEAATLGAELSQKLEPNVLDGIRYHLALSCFLAGRGACVSGLGPGKPGTPLAMLIQASADRAAAKKTTLEELGASSASLQAGLLAAQLAEGSPLEDRISAGEAAIEWGNSKLRAANAQLWPLTLQEATRIVGMLRQIQAAEAKDQGEREAFLTAGIERMREAEPEVVASKNDPLFVMQLGLAALTRSGCADYSLASGMLQEKLRQRHVELLGPIWVLGGVNAKHCGDVDVPLQN
jgi:hypothetical protein